jgi:hypothetical protein
MTQEIALAALAALGFPPRRSTSRSTLAAGHRPANVMPGIVPWM